MRRARLPGSAAAPSRAAGGPLGGEAAPGGRRAAARAVLGGCALALLLAACGKVGPVRAPGPPEQVTHPRQYPNR
ncbi:putative small lipoprotein YifL [Roseomonas alkaliterrae]|uniref:Putative small lipoprotein YifL n=1 Tax=Neoroseomonas alkaliterrae TaxID=1452450 RepID=A0A840XZW0_9PROT|nr:hypothetical protein [Neoroseomonas alkaliterrae]MBB5687942.1 putative small lipoprotein YifL [Neoroseomonas alkaliterrae]